MPDYSKALKVAKDLQQYLEYDAKYKQFEVVYKEIANQMVKYAKALVEATDETPR